MEKQLTGNHFQDNHYVVIREAISPDLASFVYNYFQNKRAVAQKLFEEKYISPYEQSWGHWNDRQVPGTYSHYADVAMETLLLRVMPVMSYITELELVPCYSYARIYKYGDVLHRHKDRPECEISTTINLGGDNWPIYLDPSQGEGKDGIKVDLNPGDMLIYKGEKLEHWREPFQGYDCGQVFLHYNDKNGPFKEKNKFDHRPILGLPSDLKKFNA